MNHVDCIVDLVSLSQERLTEILNNAGSAKVLYEFLHKASAQATGGGDSGGAKASAGSKGGGKQPFKGRKRKWCNLFH